MESHYHSVSGIAYGSDSGSNWIYTTRVPAGSNYGGQNVFTNPEGSGNVTRGKRKGVTYLIKAL